MCPLDAAIWISPCVRVKAGCESNPSPPVLLLCATKLLLSFSFLHPPPLDATCFKLAGRVFLPYEKQAPLLKHNVALLDVLDCTWR
ncbi:hypothetical protein VIGAN_03164200 [Vigna angularis var. angularis]|uniref:Uncharacterized protein n=1 Tax=Vigna angularis var. angularis TaxID=157739 RepID=A0A0S3RMH0_PHAAN|nr:hypothetical protein VIGAN_03164200 [Vigna angularis var. angularis]